MKGQSSQSLEVDCDKLRLVVTATGRHVPEQNSLREGAMSMANAHRNAAWSCPHVMSTDRQHKPCL